MVFEYIFIASRLRDNTIQELFCRGQHTVGTMITFLPRTFLSVSRRVP